MTYRIADSLLVLQREVNRHWPNRSKASDGMVGDAAHRSRGSASDHNPWIIDDHGIGVVRAFDITSRDINADWLAEHFRLLGKRGDARMIHHGYVIWNRRIASEVQNWSWRTYNGPSPHTEHVHVSVSRWGSGYDSHASWGVETTLVPPKPKPPVPGHPSGGNTHELPVLRRGMMNNRWVALVQRFLGVKDDGDFGPKTEAAVRRYQKMRGFRVDGVVGSQTWAPIRKALHI